MDDTPIRGVGNLPFEELLERQLKRQSLPANAVQVPIVHYKAPRPSSSLKPRQRTSRITATQFSSSNSAAKQVRFDPSSLSHTVDSLSSTQDSSSSSSSQDAHQYSKAAKPSNTDDSLDRHPSSHRSFHSTSSFVSNTSSGNRLRSKSEKDSPFTSKPKISSSFASAGRTPLTESFMRRNRREEREHRKGFNEEDSSDNAINSSIHHRGVEEEEEERSKVIKENSDVATIPATHLASLIQSDKQRDSEEEEEALETKYSEEEQISAATEESSSASQPSYNRNSFFTQRDHHRIGSGLGKGRARVAPPIPREERSAGRKRMPVVHAEERQAPPSTALVHTPAEASSITEITPSSSPAIVSPTPLSSALHTQLATLQSEISLYQSERSRLHSLTVSTQHELSQLKKDNVHMKERIEEEKNRFSQYKIQEEKKLRDARREIERMRRTILSLPTRTERETIDKIKEDWSKEKKEWKDKEEKLKHENERLRGERRELRNEINRMRAEKKKSEEERVNEWDKKEKEKEEEREKMRRKMMREEREREKAAEIVAASLHSTPALLSASASNHSSTSSTSRSITMKSIGNTGERRPSISSLSTSSKAEKKNGMEENRQEKEEYSIERHYPSSHSQPSSTEEKENTNTINITQPIRSTASVVPPRPISHMQRPPPLPTPTSALVRTIKHSGDRSESVYEDGSRIINFNNGTTKEIKGDRVRVWFANGDWKETKREKDNNKNKKEYTTESTDYDCMYWYSSRGIFHISYSNGIEIFDFGLDGQMERHWPDGRKEIWAEDGSVKEVKPDGTEINLA